MRALAIVLLSLLYAGCTERPPPPPAQSTAPAATPAAPATQTLQPATAPATSLTCDWPGFARSTSVERLTELFGATNVKVLDSEEGFTPVILFPKDPKQEIQLRVFNGAEFQGASVESAASTWTLPGGVGMGTSLEDVARANGGPFEIHLYQGGAGIQDWKGGALGSGRCTFFVTFNHQNPQVTGASTRMSDDPDVRAMGLKVFRFGVN